MHEKGHIAENSNSQYSESSTSHILNNGISDTEMEQKRSERSQVNEIVKELDRYRRDGSEIVSRIKLMPLEPTQEERAKAFENLEKQISRLIPMQDRQLLLSLGKAILNGDLPALEKLVKDLGKDAERLERFIDEIAKQFKNAGLNIQIEISDQGKVLLYRQDLGQCLEISPSGERTRIRPLTTRLDGTVILEPGTVIGKKANDVLIDLANRAIVGSTLGGKSGVHRFPGGDNVDDKGINLFPGHGNSEFPAKPIELLPQSPKWERYKHLLPKNDYEEPDQKRFKQLDK